MRRHEVYDITQYIAVNICIIIQPKMNSLLLNGLGNVPVFPLYTHYFIFWNAFAPHLCIWQPYIWSETKFKSFLFQEASQDPSFGSGLSFFWKGRATYKSFP